MYTNVYYDRTKSEIHLWYYDQNDKKRKHIIKPFVPHFFVRTTERSEWHDINGNPLRLMCSGYKTYRRYEEELKRYAEKKIPTYGSYTSPETQFLVMEYLNEEDLLDKVDVSKIKICYLDIECENEKGFPKYSDPKEKINLITLKYNNDDNFYVYGLINDYTGNADNIIYKKFDDEISLLKKMVSDFRRSNSDILTGWNIHGFDIPYLYERIQKLMGKEEADKLSPVNRVGITTFKNREKKENQNGYVKGNQKREIFYNINGISVLDYLEIYKKFSSNVKESYSLNFIASSELKKGKIKLSKGFKEYKSNWNNFVEYNINDVSLVEQLEQKLGMMNIAISLAYMFNIPFKMFNTTVTKYNTIFGKILRKRNIAVENKKVEEAVRYKGAHVEEPIRGKHDYVVTFDISSLYPSIMRQYNISPETKLYKMSHEDASYVINSFNNKSVDENKEIKIINNKPISLKDLKKKMTDDKLTITLNGVIYSNKKGIVGQVLDKWYKMRSDYKKKMLKCKLEKNDNDYKKYYNKQYVLKITLNSLYGYIGNHASHFYDIDNAEAVTITGQFIIKNSISIINNYFKKQYGLTENVVVAADTDSLMIRFDIVAKKLNIKLTEETLEKYIKVVQTILSKYTTSIMKATNCQENLIVFNREKICRSALFLQKKHYIMLILNDEGKDVRGTGIDDELLIKGIELVRSSTPQAIKKVLKECVFNIMRSENKQQIDDFIINFYNKFNTLPLSDISFPRGITDIEKYKVRDSNESGDDDEDNKVDNKNAYQVGTPIHAKGAMLYNKLLNQYSLTNKYEPIRNSDKIKFIYLKKNNPFYNNTIAFKDELPVEFKMDNYIDRETQFEKVFIEPLKRIYLAMKWVMPNYNIKNGGMDDLFD